MTECEGKNIMQNHKRFALNVPLDVEEKSPTLSRVAWGCLALWGVVYVAATVMGVN